MSPNTLLVHFKLNRGLISAPGSVECCVVLLYQLPCVYFVYYICVVTPAPLFLFCLMYLCCYTSSPVFILFNISVLLHQLPCFYFV